MGSNKLSRQLVRRDRREIGVRRRKRFPNLALTEAQIRVLLSSIENVRDDAGLIDRMGRILDGLPARGGQTRGTENRGHGSAADQHYPPTTELKEYRVLRHAGHYSRAVCEQATGISQNVLRHWPT